MTNYTVDTTKGYDVMKGAKVVGHFTNYEMAWEYAKKYHLTLRYYEKREGVTK